MYTYVCVLNYKYNFLNILSLANVLAPLVSVILLKFDVSRKEASTERTNERRNIFRISEQPNCVRLYFCVTQGICLGT